MNSRDSLAARLKTLEAHQSSGESVESRETTGTKTTETRPKIEALKLPERAAQEADRQKHEARQQQAAPSPPSQSQEEPRRRGRPLGSKNRSREPEPVAPPAPPHDPEEFKPLIEFANLVYESVGAPKIDEGLSVIWCANAARMADKYGELPYMLEIMFTATSLLAFGPPTYIAYKKLFPAEQESDSMTVEAEAKVKDAVNGVLTRFSPS